MKTTIRSLLVAAALAPLVIACSASPGDESTGASNEELGRAPVGGIGGIGTIGPVQPPALPVLPPPAFPTSNEPTCPTVNPQCSVDAWTYDPAADEKYAELGCTGEYRYFTGQAAGLLGGIFIVCNASPAVTQAFPYGIVETPVCDKCLPTLPSTQVYVLLEGFMGPNCQTGCPIGTFGGSSGGSGGTVQTGTGGIGLHK